MTTELDLVTVGDIFSNKKRDIKYKVIKKTAQRVKLEYITDIYWMRKTIYKKVETVNGVPIIPMTKYWYLSKES